MKRFKHIFSLLFTLSIFGSVFSSNLPRDRQPMPPVPCVDPTPSPSQPSNYPRIDRGLVDPCSEPEPIPCPPLNCPPCINPCFVAGFFIASDTQPVPHVGSNFSVISVGTEVEDGVTLGLFAISYNRPFCCPVSIVAFSSGISVSGSKRCGLITVDRPVEVRSSTKSNAVLRVPLGAKVTFKAMPVT